MQLTAETKPITSRWILKQRPVGDWVIDQYDHTTGHVHRYGPYHSRDTAQEMLDELVKEPRAREEAV